MMTVKQKIQEIDQILKDLFPNPKCELIYNTDFELLFAIILSAQTTDKQVNTVAKNLFEKYPSLIDYVKDDLEKLEKNLSALGLYKAKAKHLKLTATIIHEKHDGVVPKNYDDLIKLAGVGRKTANVFLWEYYSINNGMAIDTHVKRLSYRLGLSKHDDVNKIEIDLCKYLDEQSWGNFGHRLILYGRYYWPARKQTHSGPLNKYAIKKHFQVEN
jgi:endonuclease III